MNNSIALTEPELKSKFSFMFATQPIQGKNKKYTSFYVYRLCSFCEQNNSIVLTEPELKNKFLFMFATQPIQQKIYFVLYL